MGIERAPETNSREELKAAMEINNSRARSPASADSETDRLMQAIDLLAHEPKMPNLAKRTKQILIELGLAKDNEIKTATRAADSSAQIKQEQ